MPNKPFSSKFQQKNSKSKARWYAIYDEIISEGCTCAAVLSGDSKEELEKTITEKNLNLELVMIIHGYQVPHHMRIVF